MPKAKKTAIPKIDNRKERRKSVQQSIPFDECYENGLFRMDESTYSFICELSDCGYLSKTDSEQNRKYQTYLSILNELPSNVHYQEFIYNLPIDSEQYLAAIASKADNYTTDYEKTFFDLQRKFVAGIGRESSKRRYLIAFSYRNEAGENPYDILYDTLTMLQDKFLELGSGIRKLNPKEVFAELYHVYNPFGGTMPEIPSDLFRKGLSVRDIICPDGIEYKPNYIRLGDAYCRVFSITSYGSEIVDNLIHKLLSQNVMLYVSKHLEHESKEEAIQSVKSQLKKLESDRQTRLKDNAKRHTNYIPLELQMSIDGCNEVLTQLYGNEEFFRMTVYVMVAAPSLEELKQYSEVLCNRAPTVHCTLRAVSFNQEKALASLLPLGKDYLKRHQFMLSSEAAVATPFSYESYFDPDGFYYGLNDRSGTAAILNRKLDKSSNGFVFGVTGAGKGIFVKNEITNVLYQPFCERDDVIVIDPTGEYLPIAEACNGRVISLTAASDTHINPFHISEAQLRMRGRDVAIARQMEFIVAFLAQIKEIEPLSATEKNTIDALCMELYREKEKPTLNDFYEKLCRSDRAYAANIKDWLERYVKGSITLFAGESTDTERCRFTVYDLRDLTGDLKNLGMLAMMTLLQNRVMENNAAGKWTWIYIDEFHRFFDENRNPYSAEMFARMFSELRKFGAIITGITQLPLPVIESKTGSTMLANSSFVVSSELDASNIEALAPLYSLNEEQQRVLAAPQIGQYILRTKGAPIQLRLLYPGKKAEDKNLLYDLFNTDFKDRAL